MNKPPQKARRASFVIVFGEDDERWSFPDPGHPIVDDAQHRIRYAALSMSALSISSLERLNNDALTLADAVSALNYLIHTCPTTKLACEKLAAVRAAVRNLPTNKDA